MAHLKVKLNNGNPVCLCSKCDKILRSATNGECLNPRLYPPEYCDKCLEKIVSGIQAEYKHWT